MHCVDVIEVEELLTLRKNLCMVLAAAAGAGAGAEDRAGAAAGPDAEAWALLLAGLSVCDAVTLGCSCWAAFLMAFASSVPVAPQQYIESRQNTARLAERVVHICVLQPCVAHQYVRHCTSVSQTVMYAVQQY